MKNVAIEHRIVKISVATWICTIITMAIQLITVPVCLHYWGKNMYGTWLAVYAAFTLMRTIDYGYTIYVGNKINIMYHSNPDTMRHTLASAIWGILVLGLVQLLFLTVLYLSNHLNLIIKQHHNQHNAQIFLSLLIMSVCWICSASYIGIVHRILNTRGMLYQSTWMMMWLQVAQFIVIIVAAILRLNILPTAILFALVSMLFYFASALYVRLLLPEYYPWWEGAKITIGLKNIWHALPLTFGWVLNQGGISAIILLISLVLGPVAVVIFTTLRTISNLWTTLVNSFTQPLLPDAVSFHANNKWQNLLSFYNIHQILISGIINLSLLLVYPFLGIIFEKWTAYHLPFDKTLLNLLLSTVVISAMSSFMSSFLAGINTSGYIVISSATRGGVALLLGWFLLTKYGTAGLGFAILIAEVCVLLLTCLWFFYQILSKIGCEFNALFLNWSWISSISVVAYLLSQSFNLPFNKPIYYGLTLISVIITTIFAWQKLDTVIKQRMLALIKQQLVRR